MSAIAEYEAMKSALDANIEAIRQLINQADELSKTIETVTDTTVKNSLDENVKSLNASIDHLIVETNKLFKKYISLANSVL